MHLKWCFWRSWKEILTLIFRPSTILSKGCEVRVEHLQPMNLLHSYINLLENKYVKFTRFVIENRILV